MTVVLDRDDHLLLGLLDWVRCAEDLLELLEGTANSLDRGEVPNDGFDDVPTDEDLHVT